MHYYRDMKITQFNNPDLIHACTLAFDFWSPSFIDRQYHIKKDHHKGIVYFICVDDVIYKVGGSTDHIKNLIGQYCLNLNSKADPKTNRFSIGLMMAYLLKEGHKVDFYYIKVQPYVIKLRDMVSGEMVEVVADDFHGFETGYIQHVIDLVGHCPIWNIAEGDHKFVPQLKELYDERLALLNSGDCDPDKLFDYKSFFNKEWVFEMDS